MYIGAEDLDVNKLYLFYEEEDFWANSYGQDDFIFYNGYIFAAYTNYLFMNFYSGSQNGMKIGIIHEPDKLYQFVDETDEYEIEVLFEGGIIEEEEKKEENEEEEKKVEEKEEENEEEKKRRRKKRRK